MLDTGHFCCFGVFAGNTNSGSPKNTKTPEIIRYQALKQITLVAEGTFSTFWAQKKGASQLP
jgi:hypothetical protein